MFSRKHNTSFLSTMEVVSKSCLSTTLCCIFIFVLIYHVLFDILQDPVLKRHKSTTLELFFPDDSKFFLPFNQSSCYSADVLGSNVYNFSWFMEVSPDCTT